MEISIDQKRRLLQLARNSIVHYFQNQTPLELKPEPTDPLLSSHSGAFVTLHLNGDLRGCVGLIMADVPLHKTICEMACKAAFEDDRFSPLNENELPLVDLEISIMSTIAPLQNKHDIEIGKTGLIVRKGSNQGLLLPQVAEEWNWSVDQFLSETCYKAGLPRYAWQQDGINIFYFTATVFGEKDSA